MSVKLDTPQNNGSRVARNEHSRQRRLRIAEAIHVPCNIHLRIAADIVKLSTRFESKIMIAKEDNHVDGKSILGVLMLGIARGTELRIIATGRDAEEAMVALIHLIETVQE
jgi:phosphocarrier protein HPr